MRLRMELLTALFVRVLCKVRLLWVVTSRVEDVIPRFIPERGFFRFCDY